MYLMSAKVHMILFCVFIFCIELISQNSDSSSLKTIYIAKLAWHTEIIIEREAAVAYFPKLEPRYSDYKYMGISWGDMEYFPAPKGTIGLAIKAILWPTKSTLLVMNYKHLPLWSLEKQDYIEIQICEECFISMLKYFSNSFAIDSSGNPRKIPSEIYNYGTFYLSKEKYHLFKTCNVWTAKALQKAGIPVRSFFALRARNVLRQLHKVNKSDKFKIEGGDE